VILDIYRKILTFKYVAKGKTFVILGILALFYGNNGVANGRSPAVERGVIIEFDRGIKARENGPPINYNFSQPHNFKTQQYKLLNNNDLVEGFNIYTFFFMTLIVFLPFALWFLIMSKLDKTTNSSAKRTSEPPINNIQEIASQGQNDNDDYNLPKAS